MVVEETITNQIVGKEARDVASGERVENRIKN
jgi:hypothetical protein